MAKHNSGYLSINCFHLPKLLTVFLFLALSVWLHQERWFLRALIIPEWLVPSLATIPFPAQNYSPAKNLKLPKFNFETREGIFAAMNFVRGWSPVAAAVDSTVPRENTTEWLRALRYSGMYCTDAAQFLALLAHRAGHPTREVHLYHTPGVWDGSAHTIMEFWSYSRKKWLALDSQTGVAYIDTQLGKMLGIAEIPQAYSQGRLEIRQIVDWVDPYYDSEKLLANGLKSVVISLIPPKNIGASGFTPFPRLALMLPDQKHPAIVWQTKIGFLLWCLLLVVLTVWAQSFLRSHKS